MFKNIGTKFLERQGEREREREIIKRQHAPLCFLPVESLRRVRGVGGWGLSGRGAGDTEFKHPEPETKYSLYYDSCRGCEGFKYPST